MHLIAVFVCQCVSNADFSIHFIRTVNCNLGFLRFVGSLDDFFNCSRQSYTWICGQFVLLSSRSMPNESVGLWIIFLQRCQIFGGGLLAYLFLGELDKSLPAYTVNIFPHQPSECPTEFFNSRIAHSTPVGKGMAERVCRSGAIGYRVVALDELKTVTPRDIVRSILRKVQCTSGAACIDIAVSSS